MPDLISREALLSKVEYDEYYHSNEIRDIANDTPTVDAVPVVRCEDCRYSRERHENECFYLAEGVLICTSSEATDDCWNAVWPDHFCSYGERREDNAAD